MVKSHIDLYCLTFLQDIIPPHGFIHKPSMVWPVETQPSHDGRIRPSESPPPPKPGHADTLIPSNERIAKDALGCKHGSKTGVSQKDMLELNGDASQINGSVNVNSQPCNDNVDKSWYPKPPKVLMDDPNTVPLELRSQIQLYATNEYVG